MVPDSKLVDSIPHHIKMPELLSESGRLRDLAVLHTSTPSFGDDVGAIEALVAANPRLKAGFTGAGRWRCSSTRDLKYSEGLDFVARNEFDFTIRELCRGARLEGDRRTVVSQWPGRRDHAQQGTRYPGEHGGALPFASEVYKRDLKIENYLIGYLKHPLCLGSTPDAAANRVPHLLGLVGRRRSAAIAIGPAASAT